MLVTDETENELWLVRAFTSNWFYVYRFSENQWTTFCDVCGLWHSSQVPRADRHRYRLTTREDWQLLSSQYAPYANENLWKYCPQQFKEQLRVSN